MATNRLPLAFFICTIALGTFSQSTPQKIVALTFDDGPRPAVLKILLPELAQNHVPATFFINGCNATPQAEQMLHEMALSGHSIQNHTFGHGNFKLMEKKYGRAWILRDIDRNAALIKRCTGTQPTFLRPPFWVIWPDLQKDLESRGYFIMTLATDINSLDYALDFNPDKRATIVPRLMKIIRERERRGIFCHIIVMHELKPTALWVVPDFISKMQQQGYVFVTIDKAYPCVKSHSLHGG